MTLVASFSIDQHPIILGDLMLSRSYDGMIYKPFKIPTHDDVNRKVHAKTGYLICGLVQKVNLLNPYLSVAWAGTQRDAMYVLTQLQAEAAKSKFRASALPFFFDELSSRRCIDLYLTGLLIDGADGELFRIVRFAWDSDLGWNSRRFQSSVFDECYIGGLGSCDFENTISSITSIPKASRKLKPHEAALAITLSVIGQLKGDQMRVSRGLDALYGGGFEFATLMDGELRKVGDVTYHFWDVVCDGADRLTITLHSALKLSYYRDFLLVRRFEPIIADIDLDSEARSRDELFVIPPVYRELSEKEKTNLEKAITWPPLNSRFSVFYAYLPQAPAERRILTIIHLSSPDRPAVNYIESSEGIRMELRSELLQRFKTRIQNALKGAS